MNNRDDFTPKTKEILMKRAAYRCSNPSCKILTVGAHTDKNKVNNIGIAAHIYAAAPGGPRYNKEMSSEERSNIDNGIWLCNTCSRKIDNDPELYPSELLLRWKEKRELETLREINSLPEALFSANSLYANSFKEPLFLHKSEKNTKVNLVNLFVPPRYSWTHHGYYPDSELISTSLTEALAIEDCIAAFSRQSNSRFFIIEGDAGSGKTTLIAWINYLTSVQNKKAIKMLDGRTLLTIRLRDLDREIIQKRSILSALLAYMNLSSFDEFDTLFPRALLILDGFDELCLIEGISSKNNTSLNDLMNLELADTNIIITTRPKFVAVSTRYQYWSISIEHFNKKQREEWIDRYCSKDYCNKSINDEIYDYLMKIDDDVISCICDTPMTLYMLVAKPGTEKYLHNSWALYHHIFFDVLNETEYNKMFPNPERKYRHAIAELRDVLYRISEEIAFLMYTQQNSAFYLSEIELSDIIQNLSKEYPILKNGNMSEISEKCFGLCCYWKSNKNRGVIEFLHNNIRDFFLAEKIMHEIEVYLHQLLTSKAISESMIVDITNTLCKLFQYGELQPRVCEFILLRSYYYAYDTSDASYAHLESEVHLLPHIIEKLSSPDLLQLNFFKNIKMPGNIHHILSNILAGIVALYRPLYEPYLQNGDKIIWYHPGANSENCILLPFFKSSFCQVPITMDDGYILTLASNSLFRHYDFSHMDLRNIGFQSSDIQLSDFTEAVLCGCDFSYADLSGSNFINADIHYASLQGANLENCTFTGADLRGTELPDGFCSLQQSEQEDHLRSLNMQGLVI